MPPINDNLILRHWNLLDEFSGLLGKAELGRPSPSKRQSLARGGPKRLLTEHDYLKSFLFAQFNPVIDSMRGLCAASNLDKVQESVCTRPISLGSFSEAQHVFNETLVERVFTDLLKKDPDVFNGPGSRHARALLIDSTVLRAVPRMGWAEWRHQGKTQRAVRLHLKFHVLAGEPAGVIISEGRKCERVAFAQMLKPGEFYVGDRNYGRDYKLLKRMDELGCGYIFRLCEGAHSEVLESFPISEEDRAAGVVSDCLVRLGKRSESHYGPVRLVRIERESMDEPLLLLTNRLDPEDYSAALVGELYRSRWNIEMFFRWFKCVLGRPDKWHWMAESEQGVAIQIYCALIAALLLARRFGRLPTKRLMELLRFHQMGMVSAGELEAAVVAMAASSAAKAKTKKV